MIGITTKEQMLGLRKYEDSKLKGMPTATPPLLKQIVERSLLVRPKQQHEWHALADVLMHQPKCQFDHVAILEYINEHKSGIVEKTIKQVGDRMMLVTPRDELKEWIGEFMIDIAADFEKKDPEGYSAALEREGFAFSKASLQETVLPPSKITEEFNKIPGVVLILDESLSMEWEADDGSTGRSAIHQLADALAPLIEKGIPIFFITFGSKKKGEWRQMKRSADLKCFEYVNGTHSHRIRDGFCTFQGYAKEKLGPDFASAYTFFSLIVGDGEFNDQETTKSHFSDEGREFFRLMSTAGFYFVGRDARENSCTEQGMIQALKCAIPTKHRMRVLKYNQRLDERLDGPIDTQDCSEEIVNDILSTTNGVCMPEDEELKQVTLIHPKRAASIKVIYHKGGVKEAVTKFIEQYYDEPGVISKILLDEAKQLATERIFDMDDLCTNSTKFLMYLEELFWEKVREEKAIAKATGNCTLYKDAVHALAHGVCPRTANIWLRKAKRADKAIVQADLTRKKRNFSSTVASGDPAGCMLIPRKGKNEHEVRSALTDPGSWHDFLTSCIQDDCIYAVFADKGNHDTNWYPPCIFDDGMPIALSSTVDPNESLVTFDNAISTMPVWLCGELMSPSPTMTHMTGPRISHTAAVLGGNFPAFIGVTTKMMTVTIDKGSLEWPESYHFGFLMSVLPFMGGHHLYANFEKRALANLFVNELSDVTFTTTGYIFHKGDVYIGLGPFDAKKDDYVFPTMIKLGSSKVTEDDTILGKYSFDNESTFPMPVEDLSNPQRYMKLVGENITADLKTIMKVFLGSGYELTNHEGLKYKLTNREWPGTDNCRKRLTSIEAGNVPEMKGKMNETVLLVCYTVIDAMEADGVGKNDVSSDTNPADAKKVRKVFDAALQRALKEYMEKPTPAVTITHTLSSKGHSDYVKDVLGLPANQKDIPKGRPLKKAVIDAIEGEFRTDGPELGPKGFSPPIRSQADRMKAMEELKVLTRCCTDGTHLKDVIAQEQKKNYRATERRAQEYNIGQGKTITP